MNYDKETVNSNLLSIDNVFISALNSNLSILHYKSSTYFSKQDLNK